MITETSFIWVIFGKIEWKLKFLTKEV